jgi:hypothetical protein
MFFETSAIVGRLTNNRYAGSNNVGQATDYSKIRFYHKKCHSHL